MFHQPPPTLADLPAPPVGKRGWPWTEGSPGASAGTMEAASWPRVTIVTPSYNQGAFLEETIRSVLLQGYPNLEYVVMDGASTDGSVDIIRRYAPWLAHWISERDAGQSDALNRGFARATGQILNWINSDDFLLPGALYEVVAAAQRYPEAGGWFGACQAVDQAGRLFNVRRPQRVDVEGLADKEANWVLQPACFFSRAAWAACGPLDTFLQLTFDFDFWLRVARHFVIVPLQQELAAARSHGQAKTRVKRDLMWVEISLVQARHGFEERALKQIAARSVQSDRPSILSRAVWRGAQYFAEAQQAHLARDWTRLRRLLLQALANDPSYLANPRFRAFARQAWWPGLRRE